MVRKVIALYVTIGAIASLIYYIVSFGLWQLLVTAIPSLLALLVFVYYIITSLFYLKHPKSSLSNNLLLSTIIIQSISLEAFGIFFSNFYFPNFSIVFDLSSDVLVNWDYHLFSYKIKNGYFEDQNNLRLSINLVEFSLVFLFLDLNKVSGRERQ